MDIIFHFATLIIPESSYSTAKAKNLLFYYIIMVHEARKGHKGSMIRCLRILLLKTLHLTRRFTFDTVKFQSTVVWYRFK